MDSVSETELKSLILRLQIANWTDSKVATTLITQLVSLINSVDLEVTSLTAQTISLFKTVDFDSQSKPLTEFISLISQTISVVKSTNLESELMPHLAQIWNLETETEVRSLIKQIINDVVYTSMESELIQRLSRLIICDWMDDEFTPLFKEIISLIGLIDLESNPKPGSELMSLITQTISLFNSISMDLESQPKPIIDLLSYIGKILRSESRKFSYDFVLYVKETSCLEPEPELMSLIHQIISLVKSKTLKKENLIAVSAVQVTLKEGIFCVNEDSSKNKWDCLLPARWIKFKLTSEAATHFICLYCNGENHKEYNKLPVQVKHTLHKKHSLQLVYFRDSTMIMTRKCYCCGENLLTYFYCCLVCDCAMNTDCVERSPLLSIDYPKWHEHTLTLFPRKSSLTCDLCALSDSSCPFYICPPCDFVAHHSCISLPRVIKISRHCHRISFTHTFEQGDWSCGICRRKINNDYGCYSCYKDSCLFAAHSKCATQSNVWDGKELEGVQEEIEEILEPFVRINDGIIEHFSHPEHHLRIDENTGRDYDDYKQCQACITPIYFGNLYSCMNKCDFILHEECANLSRRIHHPIHPHVLTLVTNYDGETIRCSACHEWCTSFFYLCSEEGCAFKLHVQCAAISEPLVHGSHIHPLYLTSKPKERRSCCVCKGPREETWNCIESECDYSLCFKCAVVPQKVRYKHDKHMFTLCYGDDTSTMASWCEICENKIDPTGRFYTCDEDCCVTLHIECLIGKDLYMKPGWSWLFRGLTILVVPNNHQSRPICNCCKVRCSQKVAFHASGVILEHLHQ